jgi:cellulose synthase/poly-beta-1,6-N-acetylglucosamine synthase-like glycosyltransferase
MLVELSIGISAFLSLLTLGDIYLIINHGLRRSSALVNEQGMLQLAWDRRPLDRMCVQLPVYNEAASISGAILTACQLDWPKELLEVLVLDDSDDQTSSIITEEIVRQVREGFSIKVLRREERRDYKAGALQNGLQATTAEYIAIFDVDFRPTASFLRQGVAVLMADPTLAFVQARLEFRNRSQNWLTRAQGLEQDVHYAFEQAARCWSGVPMMFNGTSGIWRRAAMVQAGGWSAHTLGEDQDLSWRTLALGWNSRLLFSVTVQGELPPSMRSLLRQRARWAKGATQAARVLPQELMLRLSWDRAIVFCLLTAFNTAAAPLLVLLMVLAVFGVIESADAGRSLLYCLLTPVALIVIARTVGAAMATSALGRRLGPSFWKEVGAMWALQAVLVPISALAFVQGLFWKGGNFVRTPKGES